MEIEYLNPDFVLYIHFVAIDDSFCEYDGHVKYDEEMRGIKDVDLFLSAIEQPKATFDGKDLYPTIVSKAACYLRSLAMNHPFFDGNKRTALLSTVVFLEMTGYKMTSDDDTLYNIVKNIVEQKKTIGEIEKILTENIRISKMSKFKEKFKILNKIFNK